MGCALSTLGTNAATQTCEQRPAARSLVHDYACVRACACMHAPLCVRPGMCAHTCLSAAARLHWCVCDGVHA